MQSINTNFAGLVAQRNLTKNTASLTTSIERLSSGLRINGAKDDAAGLAISERMNSQIRGQEVAKRTANDGISLLQVADGALGTVSDNLQRMRDLAVQSQNGTLSADDRTNLNTEYQALSSEITRVADSTKFNDNAVFSATAVDVQIGANTTANDKLSVTVGALTTVAGDLTSAANGATAITAIDAKLKSVTTTRSTLGANINRIDSAISNLDTNTTNLSTARGRIVDADFAKESAALTRTQILQQAGSAMLSQANQLPQGVLSLLPR